MPDARSPSRPASRDRLVAIAAELLEEGGPAAVTFREVGRRAGLSHNAAHKLFGGKAQLLAAVAVEGLDELDAAVTANGDDLPLAAVRRAMHAYVAQAQARPQRFQLTYGSWPDETAELHARARATRARIMQAVTRAQGAGQLPPGDADRVTALLQSAAHGAAHLSLVGHLGETRAGGVGSITLVDDLIDALASAAGRGGSASG